MLWAVTKHELGKQAKFDDGYFIFLLKAAPAGIDVAGGSYFPPSQGIDGHRYRLGHPLAQHLIGCCIAQAHRRDHRLRLHGVAADRRIASSRLSGGAVRSSRISFRFAGRTIRITSYSRP